MAVTKYILFMSACLVIGVLMNPISSNHANKNSELNSDSTDKNDNFLESLEREAALLNLKRKLSSLNDDDASSVEELTSLLEDQELEDLADELADNDYDGKIISKKSAPRRIFIGNLKIISFLYKNLH
jgi:hypothetical protein